MNVYRTCIVVWPCHWIAFGRSVQNARQRRFPVVVLAFNFSRHDLPLGGAARYFRLHLVQPELHALRKSWGSVPWSLLPRRRLFLLRKWTWKYHRIQSSHLQLARAVLASLKGLQIRSNDPNGHFRARRRDSRQGRLSSFPFFHSFTVSQIISSSYSKSNLP